MKPPPDIKINVLEKTILPLDGFLRICRAVGQFIYPDGSTSDQVTFDTVLRESADAVVILPFYKEKDIVYTYLRSCIRPALTMFDWGDTEEFASGNLYELAAGLVEPGEDLKIAAARELREEIGFTINPEDLAILGSRVFPSVGTVAERLHFYAIQVNPAAREEPSLDGSPFEHQGQVIAISLVKALWWVEDGSLPDAKTEIGLTRLKRYLHA